ncbi:hypothetical protein SAMN06265371_104136 [Lutibacter agarilyticus]|uniref:GIY-YIG catalytic domain-containing protein n=1 Tax=Lutibacter agarilyticus TaxID=1109740 RepID=A0A238WWN2_9FLAO|nr:hypothetical protein [Lutibacter agarilyticus]SNR50942.1 hypothetical protein SAMN06265371_104136 [Lutibacter agarilyticus]
MKKYNLPVNELEKVVNEIELHLLDRSNRISFTYETNWNKENFPKAPGVYAAFENDDLIYIGQTAELKSRMSDIRRTYNHTLRKKLGKKEFDGELIKNKFSDEIEEKLTNYMVENISFSFQEISFGRLEVESQLVKKYDQKNGVKLLNSKSVRGLK